jgi:hypothetical protein
MEPALSIKVREAVVHAGVDLGDGHQRVQKTVGIFADRILEAGMKEEAGPEICFVVIQLRRAQIHARRPARTRTGWFHSSGHSLHCAILLEGRDEIRVTIGAAPTIPPRNVRSRKH